jgi:hypothetical protein
MQQSCAIAAFLAAGSSEKTPLVVRKLIFTLSRKTLAPLFPRVQIGHQSVATPLLKASLLRLQNPQPAP